VLSYLVAGISALLSAFCYTEFAVEMPVAGGAFSYLQITFGEY
jgi:amino acid transporter